MLTGTSQHTGRSSWTRQGKRLIIESVREDGRPFRPNDWIERMSSLLATFGPDHRLHYASSVQPCIIGGEKCLVVQRELAQNNPAAYEFILKFARDNALRVQEDRRQRNQSVAQERRGMTPV